MTASTTQDIRDLVGMRSRVARGLVALYVFACFLCAASTLQGVTSVWPIFLAAVLCAVGAVVLVTTPGDPMYARHAIAVAAIGPASCALVMSAIPVPVANSLQTWTLGMSLVLYTVMSVRGRLVVAWLGLGSTIAVTIYWAVVTGQGVGYGIAFGVVNSAPLLMSTFFALTLRPLSRSIFDLRIQSTARVASEAAAAAVLDERDSQLQRLDEMARPLLERTVTGPDMNDDDVLACTLLEAELRDSLRARGLIHPTLRASVRAARSRGVTVVLLDDHAGADLRPEVRAALGSSTTEHIDRIENGSVTVRLLPAGRTALATMLVDSDDTYRVEYDHDGRPREIDD